MHDIYFTLSRIAAIIGFTMFRRGVCAAPKRVFSYFPYFIFMYFGFRYMYKSRGTCRNPTIKVRGTQLFGETFCRIYRYV